MIATIDAVELQRWMREKRRFVLVDVLPDDAYAAQHLPGAKRACVYEVDFLDQVRNLGVTGNEPVVLYGAGTGSLDSTVAAEKLERAGVAQIFNFNGGRAAWESAGGAFEGGGARPVAAPAPDNRSYPVSPDDSTIEWIGRNLNSTHRGTVRIAHGSIEVRDSQLVDGRLEIDMRSIRNADIDDAELRGVLEAHLKSDDFFDVERFPSAALVIQSAAPVAGATPGTPNYRIFGQLTVKGITHPLEFPAIVSLGDDGAFTAVAQLEIDRTRWNVVYGSGRFFRWLGKHLVNDAITLLVKIVAR
jgi:polyisoprenoid-binding protein YceI